MEHIDSYQREWERVEGWKKVKELAKEHTCITDRYAQQCGDGQRERGLRAGWGRQREETSIIV